MIDTIFIGSDLLVKTSRMSSKQACDKLHSTLKLAPNYVAVFDASLQTKSGNCGISLS